MNRYRQHFGQSVDKWDRFSGPRAKRLEEIRERHLCQLSGADWSAADPDAAALHRYVELSRSQPSVEDAIEAAAEGRRILARDVDVPLGAAA
ncbi:MAG TPA: hypothetical protein VFJ46_17665 [Xanthobacteraceae bacterium]|nr:hypothetical protein [Xanthobacteraceae bacterium]